MLLPQVPKTDIQIIKVHVVLYQTGVLASCLCHQTLANYAKFPNKTIIMENENHAA